MDVVSLALAKGYTNEQLNKLPSNGPTKKVTFDGGIYSLGSDVVEGQISVTLKGRSLKNELNYNRDTWAEWTKSAGVVGDSTGLEFTADGEVQKASSLDTKLKTNTKYGIIIEVISGTISGGLRLSSAYTGSSLLITTASRGNKKVIFTTQQTLSLNRFEFYLPIETAGNKIKIKDIRVFELPAGSEIESDFTNLTANQLAQKYPYINGDSVKSTNSVRIRSVNEDETKESIAYISLPPGEVLRSLPNGTKDEVNVITGVKTKKLSELLVGATHITQMHVTNTSLDWAVIQMPDDVLTAPVLDFNVFSSLYPRYSEPMDKIDNVGKIATFSSAQKRLMIGFAKGTTLEQAKASLTGLSLIYQLATPIVTKLPAQPPLQVFQNGTIYVEPIGDPTQTTLPSVELTVPIGNYNKFGMATKDYAGAAADWVLNTDESKCLLLKATNAGANANIIAPDVPGVIYTVNNLTTKTITIKKSGGTGVAITTAKTALVMHNGTDYIKITGEV